MIFYLVTAQHGYTMESYLQNWGRMLAPRIQVLYYEKLPTIRRLPLGTYIFSDLERLSPWQRAAAAQVWDQLSKAGPGMRLLNHPLLASRRYELLHMLHRLGRNCFQVIRATEGRACLRFPVFIREEVEHTGSLTRLLPSEEEVAHALARLVKRGYDLRDLLVVEFCDTGDTNRTFRKYSAFMVGGQIIPRELIFSREWVLKEVDLTTNAMLEADRDYLDQNPDEPWLRETFRLANIDYGRIDYGIKDNVPQVWEINTNPFVTLRPVDYKRSDRPRQEQFASQRMRSAFEAIDSPQASEGVSISIDPELLEKLPGECLSLSLRRFVHKARYNVSFRGISGVLARRFLAAHN